MGFLCDLGRVRQSDVSFFSYVTIWKKLCFLDMSDKIIPLREKIAFGKISTWVEVKIWKV